MSAARWEASERYDNSLATLYVHDEFLINRLILNLGVGLNIAEARLARGLFEVSQITLKGRLPSVLPKMP